MARGSSLWLGEGAYVFPEPPILAAVRGRVLPRGLAWAGLIAGAGFLVLVLSFLIYPTWATGLELSAILLGVADLALFIG